MTATTNFFESFEQARNDAAGQAGLHRRRISTSRQLYATVTNPDSLPGMMLRVGADVEVPGDELASSEQFRFDLTEVPAGIEVSLQNTSVESTEVFLRIADDIADRISKAPSEKAAMTVFLRRFQSWQRYLKRTSSGRLSERKLLGLYGELLSLRDVLIPSIGTTRAVDSWTGPENAPQDFQFDRIAIEVKSLAHSEPQNLRISGERQLDDFGLELLILAHHRIVKHRGSGQRLPELVSEIDVILQDNPPAADRFGEKLLSLGYDPDEGASKYSDTGYSAKTTSYYRVHSGFPRLTEADLSPGMGDVSYLINASSCKPFEIETEELVSWLSEPESAQTAEQVPESQTREYKQTAWTPVGETKSPEHKRSIEKKLRTSIVKTVAALLNSGGGILTIGVEDNDLEVTGIEPDLIAKGFEPDDRDAYERLIVDLLLTQIDPVAARQIRVSFDQSGDHWVCNIAVAPSPNPRFGRPLDSKDGPTFWIRAGNSTRSLEGDEMIEYIKDHWW